MCFAQMLEMLMEKEGLSNYRLAKELGIHQTTIANWLSGVSSPRHSALKAVADRFGVTSEYLSGFDKQSELDYLVYEIQCLQLQKSTALTVDEIETIESRINALEFEYKDLAGSFPDEQIKKASSEDEAEGGRIANLRKRLEALSEEDLDKLIAMMDVLGM